MGLMQTLRDMFGELLIPLIVIVIILVSAAFAWYSIADMSFGKLETEEVTGSYTADIDYGYVNFANKDGILYPKNNVDPALSVQEIKDQVLNYVEPTSDCYSCSSCTGAECSVCGTCEGETESGRFETCKGCYDCEINDVDTKCCLYCIDNQRESVFCENLKRAIKESYVLGYESTVVEFPRKEQFDVNTITNAIQSCLSEDIKLQRGDGVQEQMCHFDNTKVVEHEVSIIPKSDIVLYDTHDVGDVNFHCFEHTTQFANTYTDNMLFTYIDSTSFDNSLVEKEKSLFETFSSYSLDYIPSVCKAKTFTNYGTYVYNGQTHTIEEDDTNYPICKTCKDINSLQEVSDLLSGKYEFNYLNSCSKFSDGPCMLHRDTTELTKEDYYEDGDEKKYYSETMMIEQPGELGDIAVSPGYHRYTKFYTFGTTAFEYDDCIFSGINPDGNINVVYPYPWDDGDVGHIKINVGNVVNYKQNECEFNVYICDSTSFANSTDETIVEIYDLLRFFEPTIDAKSDLNTNLANSYNYYEFDLDREYTADEIIAAIKQGYDYWQASSLPYYYSGTDDILNYGTWIDWDGDAKRPRSQDEAFDDDIKEGTEAFWDVQEVSFSGGCAKLESASLWSDNEASGFPMDRKSIGYSCPGGKCSGTLKLKIEITKTGPTFIQSNEIRPYIWFCTE